MLAGSVHVGRIRAVDRNLQAAFVELGLDQAGFLPLKDAPAGISEGDRLAVAVTREPGGGKGAKLTTRGLDELPEPLPAMGMIRGGRDGWYRLTETAPRLIGVTVDDADTRTRLLEELGAAGEAVPEVSLHSRSVDLFEAAGVADQVEALESPMVDLPGGGTLLIEHVATLTAVDVNSSGAFDRTATEQAAYDLNLAACREMARQIPLRGIGGLVVVDFVELATRQHRVQLVDAWRSICAEAGLAAEIRPMSPGGLVELSLPRRRPSLAEVLAGGIRRGPASKSAQTLAFEALRQALQAAGQSPARQPVIVADPSVTHALEAEAASARHHVERRIGRPLTLRPRPALPSSPYEIVLE